MRTTLLIGASGIAVLSLSAAPAIGQEVADDAQMQSAASVSSGVAVSEAAAPAATGDEILVTARRREEAAQTVPVSVAAFSAEALKQQNVVQMEDLSRVVPGFRFDFEGAKTYSILTLRGIGQTPIGDGVPGVVSYFAEAPLPFIGSNLPNFDLASIQVLKGPQGTLFGRNTLGGAVLVSPEKPSFDLGGYAFASYGRFNAVTLEGAVNIPLVEDALALRVAGQIRRQDGRTRNLNPGPDFDNVDENSFRATLLATPFDGFENTTIFQYFKAFEKPAGPYLFNLNPGNVGFVDPYFVDFLQQQLDAGPRAALSDLGDNAFANRKFWGINNNTSYETGNVTFRNIFSYRETFSNTITNATGNGPVFLPGAPGDPDVHFTLITALGLSDRSQLTNEFQVLGEAFGGNLDWVVGAFYSKDKSIGPGGTNYTVYTTVEGVDPNSYISAHVANENVAIYGQGTLDLSDMLLDGLSFTAGLRYSWDKVKSCGGGFFGGFVSPSECQATADLGLIDGVGEVNAKGSSPSWTFGLEYEATDDLFFYITTRRGYRGVSVNTPAFESPFTTGGTVVPPTPGGPGCTGPGNVCPDLRPFQTTPEERLTDVEIGFKSNWRSGDVRGRFNISAYLSKYEGALAFYNVGATGIYSLAPDYPSNQSVGLAGTDQTIKGIEVEAVIKPVPGLTFSANGAFTDSKIDEVYPAAFAGLAFDVSSITLPSPRWAGTFAASWVLPVTPLDGDVIVSSDLYVTSKFGGQSGTNLPGYEIANARISWNSIANSNIDLGLSVRNIFNKFYFAAPLVLIPTFPGNTAYPGEPRVWSIDAKVRF